MALIAKPGVITIKGGIINTHGHPRNPSEDGDGRSELIIPTYDKVFRDVIAIGNTMTPLTTINRAISMKGKWASIAKWTDIHVAGMLTEKSYPDEIVAGYDRPPGEEAWVAMKMFLRAVSNAGGHDVDDIQSVIPCLKAMSDVSSFRHKKRPMVLKIHCERKWTLLGRVIPINDRERIAVERDVEFLLKEVPEAHIEICHVSDGATIEAIRYLRQKGFNVFGEISPHYTEYTEDDLFDDGKGGTGFNSHCFCLPKFKSSKDRQIILDAMLSGDKAFHYGDDAACHDLHPTEKRGAKISEAGIVVGGQTQIAEATVAYVVEQFATAGRLEHLQGFLVDNARNLYGLPAHEGLTTNFALKPWEVPREISEVVSGIGTVRAVVAMGGQRREYACHGHKINGTCGE
jgi:dihydroorotase